MPRAFTLLELLLWLAMFGIISAVTVGNFRASSRSDAVRQAARVAEITLRRAQTATLAGDTVGGSFPIGGYGIRFDAANPGSLVLFADTSGNFDYDNGEEIAGRTVSLPSPATFSIGSTLNVVFAPPSGRVYFNGLSSPDTQEITLSAPGADLIKRVVILRLSGLVRVE